MHDSHNCGSKQMAVGMAPSMKSAERTGLPGEMDGLENDLAKLGATISELRGRLDNVLVAEPPAAPTSPGNIEPRRSRCNFSEGVASFRDRVKSNTRSLQDVLDRLDL